MPLPHTAGGVQLCDNGFGLLVGVLQLLVSVQVLVWVPFTQAMPVQSGQDQFEVQVGHDCVNKELQLTHR